MTVTLNRKIIEDVFNSKYNEEYFKKFIADLFIDVDFKDEHRIELPKDYNDFIKSAKRLCKYKYSTNGYDDTVIDIIAVNLKKTSSLDRARTAQRNFIARYLNGGRDYQKDAAIVVFYSKDERGNIADDWRLSLIKMDYVREPIPDKDGNIKKVKTKIELTPAKRFSFLIEKSGEKYSTHTVQKRFMELLEKSTGGSKLTIEDLVQVFDIEKVSKEFFDEYKKLYIKMCLELERLYSSDIKIKQDFDSHNIIIEDFAKKTMGQLVFLYFIQKKGWLGVERDKKWGSGDKNFMQNIFEKKYCEYNNFFNDVLEHLFYEALASDRGSGAWFDKLNCRIPFLNGGLFEPVNGYQYQVTDLTINNDIFKEIFDTFNLYNFTVKEDEPLEKEVAVDPEMLGKVFENLLPENIRKGSGAYYTPREIVHYMCQESLINYLYNKLNIKTVKLPQEQKAEQQSLFNNNIEQLILTEDVLEEIVTKDDISVFIKKGDSTYKNRNVVEMLPKTIEEYANELDNALEMIKVCDPAIGSGAFPVGMMNEIVRARMTLNPYINKPNRAIYELKRNAIENSIYGVDIDSGAVEIAKLRFWLSLVVDEENAENIKPLPNLDYKIMQGNSLLTSYEGIDFDEIVDDYKPKTQLQITNLWGENEDNIKSYLKKLQKQFLKTPHATEKQKIKEKIEEKFLELVKNKFEIKANEELKPPNYYENNIRNFAQNKENRNFFPWKLFFADVFEQGGFDVVVANPPYVSYREVAKKYNLSNYESFNNNQVNKPNLYVYFIEQALNRLLKQNGVLSFINPIAFLVQADCIAIRKLILSKRIYELLDLSYINVFKEADTYTVILCILNTNDIQDFKYNRYFKITDIDLDNKQIAQINSIKQDSELKIVLSENISLLNKISSNKYPLEKYVNTICGTSKEGFGKCISNTKTHLTSKVLQSSDIQKYRINWLGKYIDKKLFSEKKVSEFFNKPKIVMARMTENIRCTIDFDGYYCAKINAITAKDGSILTLKKVLALLNSTLYNYYYKEIYRALHKKGDALGFDIPSIEKLPVMELDSNMNLLVTYVDKILDITQTDDYLDNKEKPQAVKEYEKQIDIIVYKLYELTYEEVLIIDKDFTLSEDEYNNFKME